MILPGTNHTYMDRILREQGNLQGERAYGRNDGVDGGGDFLSRMLQASRGESQGSESHLIEEASRDGKQLNREELFELLAKQREEILKKLKSGDTGVKIPIGSMYLTEEEWEKLLDSFDEAQEQIRENVREKSGEELPEKRPDTTVNGDKVLAPEGTGHDLKPLEELAAEVDLKGAPEDEAERDGLNGDAEENVADERA